MHISEINIYPIKSLKGISLDSSAVEKRGLRYDRRWMLTDPDGMFFTQREVPRMATVSVELGSGGLDVSAAGFGTLHVPFEPDRGERQRVTVWQSTVDSEVYVGEISEWFSDVLSKRCQIVRMPETTERHVSQAFDRGRDIVSFADGYPLLLIGEASLDDLNRRISEAAEAADARDPDDPEREVPKPLPMNRFRPNVVIKGTNPFEEDGWAEIRIGEAGFRVAKPCARCPIPTIDQATGEFDGKEPLKTLATFRTAKHVHPNRFQDFGHTANSVLFGENLIPESDLAMIAVGDEVRVTGRR